MIEKIAGLTRFNQKILNISIIKFYKAILKLKDEVFYQYLTKKVLLKPIIEIFLSNENKTNLLHSCILDIFEYLGKEYNKKIVTHLMENYGEEVFNNPKYDRYFSNFI